MPGESSDSPSRAHPAENTHLPACDNCRSRKIKCDRALPQCGHCKKSNVPCYFSNEVKRVNTTKQLVDDVAGLNSRLSRIDESNALLLQEMAELKSFIKHGMQHQQQRGPSLAPSIKPPVHDVLPTAKVAFSADPQPASKGTRGFVLFEGSNEFYHGATSTWALFYSTKEKVMRSLQTAFQTRDDSVKYANLPEDYPFVNLDADTLKSIRDRCEQHSVVPFFERPLKFDESPELEAPPKSLVMTSLEMYFGGSNMALLVLKKAKVIKAAEEYYDAEPSQRDDAWTVIFTAIILESMSFRSKILRNDKFMLSNVDNELLGSVVNNVKRAICNLEKFSKPRLLHVQALMLLAVVVRKFFHFRVFERVISKAVQMAKWMGLQERAPRKLTSHCELERRDLMWVLYAIDKQRCITKDTSCLLYLMECDLDLPVAEQSSAPARLEYLLAQLRLTIVMEEMYRALYCAQARRYTPERRQQSFDYVRGLLDEWWNANRYLWTGGQGQGKIPILGLYVKYIFYSTKVLVYRCSNDESSKTIRILTSLDALRIVDALCTQENLFSGGLLSLHRLFCGYSIMPFYEILECILTNPFGNHKGDLQLLESFVGALGLVSNPNYPESYCARIHKACSWCVDIAKLLANGKPAQPDDEPLNENDGQYVGPSANGSMLPGEIDPLVAKQENIAQVTNGGQVTEQGSMDFEMTPSSLTAQPTTAEARPFPDAPDMWLSDADFTDRFTTDLAGQASFGGMMSFDNAMNGDGGMSTDFDLLNQPFLDAANFAAGTQNNIPNDTTYGGGWSAPGW